MADSAPQVAARGVKPGKWLKRTTIALVLLILASTSLMRDSLSLLLHFLLIFSLIFVPYAIWRKQVGWLEFGASIVLSTVLFGVLVRYAYLTPMRCEQPRGFGHALTLERSGETDDRAQASLDQDAGSISLNLSLNARPESRFARIELIETESFHPAPGVKLDALNTLSALYVPDGVWVASAQPANTPQPHYSVWRLPIFQRTADDFEAVGELTGRIGTSIQTRVKDKPFRLLRSLPGGTGTARKRELERYSYDAWLDSVFKSGRAAPHLERYRAFKDRCAPSWMFKEEPIS